MSSNIEKMEKQIDVLNQEIEMLIENASSENSYDFVTLTSIRNFMRMSLESLKDLHEENCKIWKELAELKGKQDFEFEFRGLDDKGNYVYEPNE